MGLCIPQKLLDQHSIIFGKTGSGKSSAMRHIAEHLLDHKKRVCIVDPKGDWWGLKTGADGKSPGYPIIAFGDFKNPDASDVPINEHSGKHIAELVTSGNRPCVIGMRGWTVTAMTEFWISFAAGIFNSNAGELFMFCDEFHNFAPKGSLKGKEGRGAMALHWSNRLLSEGRGLGIVFFPASQRPQKVHNDSSTSCETLIAMRVVHSADRDAIENWIEGCGDADKGKEILATLAQLKRGEAWIWSPENEFGPERVQFPMFKTFDSFAPPQLQKRISEKGWAGVDLTVVKEKMASAIEEAKANDPRHLRNHIAELSKENANLQNLLAAPMPPAKPQIKTVEKAVLKDGQLSRCEAIFKNIDASIGKLGALCDCLGNIKIAIREAVHSISGNTGESDSLPERRGEEKPLYPENRAFPTAPRIALPDHPPISGGDGKLTGPQQKILDAVAWMMYIGVTEPSNQAVAFIAGYSPNGGSSYQVPRSQLSTLGLIEYKNGKMKLTSAGTTKANPPKIAPTGAALRESVLKNLDGPMKKILGTLIEAYPRWIGNEELARCAGYSHKGGSSYQVPRSRLRTMGLIDYKNGEARAEDLLFPDRK